MKAKDLRMRSTDEMLTGIKAIKFDLLESFFYNRVKDIFLKIKIFFLLFLIYIKKYIINCRFSIKEILR